MSYNFHFNNSDPLTEEKADAMLSKTFYGDKWAEGDVAGFALLVRKTENEEGGQPTAAMGIVMLTEEEVTRFLEEHEYIGERGKFSLFAPRGEGEELEDLFTKQTEQ